MGTCFTVAICGAFIAGGFVGSLGFDLGILCSGDGGPDLPAVPRPSCEGEADFRRGRGRDCSTAELPCEISEYAADSAPNDEERS